MIRTATTNREMEKTARRSMMLGITGMAILAAAITYVAFIAVA